jgi:iron(III) transport system substrate-binding protein
MRATSADKVKSWLSGMKANVGNSVFNKHSKIVKAVASGRKSVGLVNHYYIYRHLAKHPDAPIKIVLPDQDKAGMGIAWNVAGAAIVKHTAKTEAAKKLIDFMVSEQGQKLFAEVNREYPTRPGVPAADNVPKRSSYKVANIPMRELGEYRDATLDIIESVGMP